VTDGQPQQLVAFCCAVFAAEIAALRLDHWPGLSIRYQSSMLHMKPQRLAIRLENLVEPEVRRGGRVLLIYGDCCLAMATLTALPGVVRTGGNNCCELLLGSAAYRRHAHAGAFFLFPEWARRWRHIFAAELGLNQVNATSLMGDMHRQLLYLDTGVVPVPTTELAECSSYCGLPWEVLPVPRDPLRLAVEEALARLSAMEECR
jgi:hypothetical protein